MSDESGADDPGEAEADENDPTPLQAQERIIESENYPMRVLAGAGTGKTFTMVRKIERLIEDGTPPDRILALTFTNKAADSMRSKLVEKVGPKAHDIEAYTYHAVCHEFLQEYAYHADIDPRYDIVTDADRLAIVYDVLDDVPYRFTNPDVYEDLDYADGATDRLLQFIQVMKRSGIRPDDLREYLEPPARLIELEGVVDRIENTVEEHLRVGWQSMSEHRIDEMQANLDVFRAVLQEERTRLDDTGVEGDVAAYLTAMDDTCAELSSFFDANADAIIAEDIPAAQKLPAHLFGSYGDAPKGMPSLDYQLPATLEQFIESCQTVSDLVAGYEAYQLRLREEILLDFNDLVLETLDILRDETVNDWITSQYDYVFCDEFQDTDTVQFDLVHRLVTDDQLFVVGDDDQAIYEWRGANIENIGPRLDDAYPGVDDQQLETNFRSRQPILDLANNALGELDERGSSKTLEAHAEKKDATEGVITITSPDEDDDNAGRPEQPAQIANAITRLLSGETDHAAAPYAPGDVAILVRKRRHATPIVEELRRRGIPYELAGDLAAESVGVETVVAGLKTLADPGDEGSLNRLLRMRYRLHEADLRRLNTADAYDTLQDALLELPRDAFAEPDRVARAREDLSELWTLRSTYSISRLYRELKDRLHLEWFLSAQERRDLRQLDELVRSFEEGTIEPELSAEFVDFLARHGSISEGSSQSMEEQPEPEAAAVSIMTIHKSKGLEFPVVVLPRLEADEWSPSARTYDRLEHAVSGTDPTSVDFAQRDLREARRLLHVGITRSEELLLLAGRHDDNGDNDDTETMTTDTVDAAVGDAVPWTAAGVSFPIWRTVLSSLPPMAVDATDTLAEPVDTSGRIAAVEDGDELTRADAMNRVFDLARGMLRGELPIERTDSFPIDPTALGPVDDYQLQRRHSYTSLDTLQTCTRRHYLDHMIRAFDDPTTGRNTAGKSSGVSQRIIGVIFHETAERAANRGVETVEEWRTIARQIAAARGHEDALADVFECIDRYFECEASGWDIATAERDFELDIADSTVVGQIDAICRRPDGELVVLDYKTTDHKRSLETDLQLPIYVLACREVFEEPISTAGYAYVGSIGPAIEVRDFDSEALAQARDLIRDRLREAEQSSYDEYTAGEHCQWCPHRSLPCSPDALGDD